MSPLSPGPTAPLGATRAMHTTFVGTVPFAVPSAALVDWVDLPPLVIPFDRVLNAGPPSVPGILSIDGATWHSLGMLTAPTGKVRAFIGSLQLTETGTVQDGTRLRLYVCYPADPRAERLVFSVASDFCFGVVPPVADAAILSSFTGCLGQLGSQVLAGPTQVL